ncbi:MAG: Membrane protein [Candidatus Daviesbacteria bacterium GW2011_GWA1_41_61]|uniref:Membrane protein n=1 Tax=Candidatus Daviesbacteria bacterium GW2011_GWA2_40_9 TaxID=1618424 RepID=A0A0G0U6U6_9BACT|nr:MAG: Membrane protein [Candidatus Daviesbacteria bacterium GW2011_GWC1_40_9]KKR82926.1 MAG: Membrane protein [Candidatus Daviesbacteria bacterium GW2011_GWA2_40_9]KKR92854.1 MAG: Membrane protein [Candidatus Daviesbacteria bacterium GW2011_GWB1_41_15]KKS15398.1 MAG: Membrane protein [Candidatus Daviesbacteria bacterium GW2011_GWA1_41_61]
MNWVDLLIFGVLIFFILDGWGKPFIFELMDLGGFVLSLLLSLKYYNLAASQLENLFSLPHSFANAVGFIVAWYFLEIVFFISVRLAFHHLKTKLKLPADHFFSIFPAVARGLVFVSILLVLVATFPVKPQIKKEVHNSFLGSAILSETYRLEVPLKGVFGGLVSDTLSFLTIKPRSNQRLALGFQTTDFTYDSQAEMAMVALVNSERVKVGLKVLIFDTSLREVGRSHSADMLTKGYFSHYSPEGEDVSDRASQRGIDYSVIGENLAYAPSLQLAHQGLMNSPGHRANILSADYSKIGIGVANASDFGYMFTQVFSD